MTRSVLPVASALSALACVFPAVGSATNEHGEIVIACPRGVVSMVDDLDRVEAATSVKRGVSFKRYRALLRAVEIPLPFGLTAACEVEVFTPAAKADLEYERTLVSPKHETELWAAAEQAMARANSPLVGHI